jgi:cobaltochelatase CobS
MNTTNTPADPNLKIECQVCGRWFQQLPVHLKSHDMTVAEYQAAYPGAPIVSDACRDRMAAAKLGSSPAAPAPHPAAPAPSDPATAAAQALYFGTASLAIQPDHTDPLDVEHVPVHDDEYKFWNKEALEATATAIELDLNLLKVGPTGCGKTSLVEELAALINQPVKRVNMDGDVRSSDFLGQTMITVDETTGQSITRWEDGLLPTAMRRGWWLILDELDAAPPQILFALQAVLEKGHRLVLKENGGEIVAAHPRFRIIATANTLGKGDQSGFYAGTNVLNEATLDRFGIVVRCAYPTVQQEASIIRAKTGIDTATAKQMCKVAKMVRAGAENDECFCTFSTRRILNWAALAVKMGDVARAAKFTVLQRLAGEDEDYVGGVIQRVIGG